MSYEIDAVFEISASISHTLVLLNVDLVLEIS